MLVLALKFSRDTDDERRPEDSGRWGRQTGNASAHPENGTERLSKQPGLDPQGRASFRRTEASSGAQ